MKRLTWFIAAAVLVTTAARAVSYLADPNLPFGFYYDLAWNGMLLNYIPAVLHSPADAMDLLAWASWYDQPTFYLNGMGSYVLLSPLALLLRDGWLTVKIAQVLQIAIAIAGTAWAYRVLMRGSRLWAVLAGAAYAFAPSTAFAVRHDLDMGWAIVLSPIAFAVAVLALRKIGSAALPLGGACIGIAAFCFHLEYGFFVGIPAYVLLCVYAMRLHPGRRTALFSLAGLLALCAVPAYTVLTSLHYRGLYSDWAGRISELDAASKLPLFSESWWALAAGMLQEFIIDPNPLFNASASMPFALAGGAIVWTSALTYAVLSARRAKRRHVAALAAGVAGVTLLALGANGPLAIVFEVVKYVPVLNSLRTPDRFVTLPLFAACLAAAALGERALGKRVAVAAVLSAVALGSWGLTDVREHVLATQRASAYEPQLNAVSRVVARLGSRTFSAAFVRNGTVFDTAAYGVPAPSTRSGMDIFGRYISTPSAGIGLLSRAAVASIITTPDWLADQGNAPVSVDAQVRSSGLVSLAWRGSSGVAVYRLLHARSAFTAVRRLCVSGGPGLADFVAALAQFSDAALMTGSGSCARRALMDYDPRASTTAKALDWWPGTQIFSYLPRVGDTDYAFALDRFYLNDSWYRDSVDGDSQVFARGALPIGRARFGTALHPHVRIAQNYIFRLHMATHAITRISVGVDRRPRIVRIVNARRGLRWFDFDLGALSPGDHTLDISIEPIHLDPGYGIYAGDLVDGAAIVGAGAALPAPTADALFWQIKNLADRPVNIPREHPVLERAWHTQTQLSRLAIDWPLASGRYVVSLRGTVRGAPAWIAGGTSARIVPAGATGTLLTMPIDARRDASTTIAQVGSAAAGAAIPDVTITGVTAVAAAAGSGDTTIIDAKMGAAALAGASDARNVWVNAGGIGGTGGSQITLAALRPDGHVMQAVLDSSGGGLGTLRVDCGEGETSVSAIDPVTTAVIPAHEGRCTVQVRWRTAGWIVRSLRITPLDPGAQDVAGRIWVPQGTYRFQVYATPVRDSQVAELRIDGKRALNSPVRLRGGWHAIQMRGVGRDAYALAAFASDATAGAPLPPPLHAERLSATSFNLTVPARSTVEAAVLSDGSWRARNVDTGASVTGVRCDVFETCFPDLRPGRYEVFHQWPLALRIGAAISLLAIVLACATALLALAYATRARQDDVRVAEAHF